MDPIPVSLQDLRDQLGPDPALYDLPGVRRMTATKVSSSTWLVDTETVQLVTKLDELGWECTCRRQRCRHIEAVEAQTFAMDDQSMERVA